MKRLIPLLLALLQTTSYASTKNIYEPREIADGAKLMSEKNVEISLNGIMVPTDSNYFIYEHGNAYMTHVEQSQSRLRKIEFLNGKFEAIKTGNKLEKPLSFTLSYIYKVLDSNPEEIPIYNCKNITFEKTPYPEQQIKIPNFGIITLAFNSHLEYLNCNENGSVVFGTIFCGNSGYCGQQLFGIKK
jgi:hypothetical protein